MPIGWVHGGQDSGPILTSKRRRLWSPTVQQLPKDTPFKRPPPGYADTMDRDIRCLPAPTVHKADRASASSWLILSVLCCFCPFGVRWGAA
eukprot:6387880-Amphidinium_carterae.1